MNGVQVLVPMLAMIGFFGSIITFIYMRYRDRHLERMAIMDEGFDPSILVKKNVSDKNSSLKFGLLLTGVGLGWFAGLVIEAAFDLNDAIGIVPTVMIGGGIGLIIHYFLASKFERDEV